MIDEILPPQVCSAEAFIDSPSPVLFPEEEAQRSRWEAARRREFATVRILARRALADLGLPPVAIPRGAQGAPAWPAGVVGSMTHCPGYRAAAVARSDDLPTIGVDAELSLPLPRGVLTVISLPDERRELQALADIDPKVCWDRLLFSAKEALYKAWFPLTHRWLGFEDARIRLEPDGTLVAWLLAPGPPVGGGRKGLAGRWLLRDDLLVTAIAPVRPRRFLVDLSGSRHVHNRGRPG